MKNFRNLALLFCLVFANAKTAGAQITITRQITASSDDAEEYGPETSTPGAMYLTSSDIELIRDDEPSPYMGTQKVGLRFTSLGIPKGSTITSAYITFRAIAADHTMTNSEATNLTLRGNLVANAGTFTTTTNDITNRATTSASASWTPGTWTTGTNYNSPSLVSIVQEIVNLSGWSSGNAIAVIITGTGHRAAANVDGGTGNAPILSVTFTPPSPGGVTGAAIWLRADEGLTTGSTLTWADQSGNSRNATQSTATNQPISTSNAINFNPALTFDGTNDYLALSNLSGLPTGASQVEEFAVANNLNTAGNWQHILNYGTTSSQRAFGLSKNSGNANAVAMGFGVDAISSSLEFAGGTPALLDGKYTGSQLVISSFGVQRATLATTLNLGTSIGYVGVDPVLANTTHWNGNIPEVVLFPTNLSATNCQKVNSYLAIKYGITLDQTSAYNYLASDGSTIWNATTNATWKNNITGIGRDDSGGTANTGLNQKQSKSVNTAALVTIGNGNTIATTNALNSNTFSADRSFLIFGDDNGNASAWTTTESNNSSTRQRLAREWKVQETGTVGSVKMQVPDNSSSLSTELPAEITTVYLLTDADGDFSSGATETAMTLNGTNWEVDIDLSNGQFFTFATQVPIAPGGIADGNTLWLKADAGTSTTTNGSNVTTWSDQSIYGNNASTTANSGANWTSPGANPPVYQSGNSSLALNFNPMVNFSGSKSLDGSGGMSTHNLITVFNNVAGTGLAIFGYDDPAGAGGGGQGTFWFDPTFMYHAIRNTSDNNNIQIYRPHTFGNPSTTTLVDAQHVSAATGNVWINGVAGTSTPTVTGTAPAPFSGKYRIGKSSNNAFASSPNMAEAISYNRNLSNTERQKIASYLAVKYGMTLAQTYISAAGTTWWDNAANATYHNRLTGIGREDAQGMNQKQSKSIVSGALLTLGLGSVAASNADNSNTFSTDARALLAGDDNGSTAIQRSDNPIGTCGRMTRIWKAEENAGEVGTLGLQLDLSSLSSTYGSYTASKLKLLVSGSTSFSTVLRSYTASTYASGVATFANVDLDDGEFFTLGILDGNFTTAASSNSPVCEGAALSFQASGGTTYTWSGSFGFTSNLQNPSIAFAQFSNAGTYSVTISDAFGCAEIQTLTVAVNSCDPDVCQFSVCNNATVSGSISATDADGDALTYTVSQNPTHGTLSISGNTFTYDPTNTYFGEDQFIIQACDPSGACVQCVKKLVVSSCGSVPICGTNTTLTTCSGVAATGILNATDPSGGTLTYAVVSQPANGTVSISGSNYTFTPTAGFEGATIWVYSATNANGSVQCTMTAFAENCFSTCDANGCGAANLITGGTFSNSGATIFCQNGIAVASNSEYCFKATLTNNCAACPSDAAVYFTANGVRVGTVNIGSLPLGLAKTYGYSFNTNDLGNPGSINVCLTHVNFGTPGTDIVVASPELRAISVPLPVANDDEFFLTSNTTPYSVAVLENDIFLPVGAVPTLLTAPTAGTGTAVVSGDEILFTPNAAFTGTTSFTYQVCNGICCDVATVTASITNCDIVVPRVDVGECYLDAGVWKSDVAVVFYWKDAPAWDSLKITAGSQTQYFYPTQYHTASVASVIFTGLVADGSTNVPVTVSFTTLPTCGGSASFDLPDCPAACPSGTVGGTVWRDFDNDGTKDNNETNGLSGVKVFIFNASGTLLDSTTTDAAGDYNFSGLTNGSRFRIEFRNLPEYYAATPGGTDNGSAVQFVTAPDCSADFAANKPSDYCDETPSIGVPCYVNGDISAAGVAAMDAFVYFPYDAWAEFDENLGRAVSNPGPVHVATAGQIGTTWGVAYRRQSQTLFTSAVVKRHCDLGPLGTGGIYKMDMTNPAAPTVSNWVDVQTLGINTGADPRDGSPGNTLPGSTTLPSFDLNAFDAVGKRAIGDLDFDEERNTLWFVNLNEQTLCGIENVSATTAPTAADVVGEFPIVMPGGHACAGGATVHAWGLDVHDGLVYVAVLCTEESAYPDSVDLRGYVLSFNPDNPGAGFQYVASLPMNIVKYNYGLFNYANWVDSHLSSTGLTTPILSDIEIDDDGSLILGIADRLGFQRGHQNYLPDPTMTNTTLVDYSQAGDILRLCKIGNNYVLPGSDPGCPLLNSALGDGINGGEYYFADWGPYDAVNYPSPDKGFAETAMGALAFLPGSGQVLSTQNDVVAFRSAGVVTFNNATGDADNRYQVYDEYMVGTQGKATGLGDLEIMCALPPLEIGNYVWLDADADGVQDASENPISGIVVELWKNGSKIAQTTTDASGEYYFSDKNAAGATWFGTGADTALQMNTAYEVRIPQSQAALSGKSLTNQNATANNGNDQNDSDASFSNGNAVISLTTGGIGFVDHSFDFGFMACTVGSITFVKTAPTCTGNTSNNNGKITITAVSNGDRVGVSLGATYSGSPSYAASAPVSTLPLDVQTAIPNAGATYTIRLFNGSNFCYRDTTVTVAEVFCFAQPALLCGVPPDSLSTVQDFTSHNSLAPIAAVEQGYDIVLGGERDVYYHDLATVQAPVSNEVYFGGNKIDVTNGAGETGRLEIQWDGLDGDAVNLNPAGLGGLNFAAAGLDRLTAMLTGDFGTLTDSLAITFEIWSNAGAASGFTQKVRFTNGVASPLNLYFSKLQPIAGGGANLSNVGAVVLKIDMTSRGGWDVSVSNPRLACCVVPTGIALTRTPPTCTGTTFNNDGKIALTAISDADKFGVSAGATYSGSPSYASATAIGSLPQDLQTAIPNSGGTYTFRFFNGSNSCFFDTTLTVAAVASPQISISSNTNSICPGATVTLTATTSGGAAPCTIQWQYLNGAIWTDISGANATTYTTSALAATTQFRAIYNCTADGCTGVASAPVLISVLSQPTLWAIDEDANGSTHLHLWSFGDYSNPTTTATDYGEIQYFSPSNGTNRGIDDADDIEAMAVNKYTGLAFILSRSKANGGANGTQALFTYNLNEAAANNGNIVFTLVGHLTRPNGQSLEALAFDPLTNRLYSADPVGNGQNSDTQTDVLMYINLNSLNANPLNASSWTTVGAISGLGNTNNYVDGLEFSENGNLYAIDGTDDDLYRIDKNTGAILAIEDNNIEASLGTVDMETMAWDKLNNRLIAIDNQSHRFIELTTGSNGSNIVRGTFLPGTPGMPSDADFEGSAMYAGCEKTTLGNVVFIDSSQDGNFDSGEGTAGVEVQLFLVGQNPLTDIPVAETVTAANGTYLFPYLEENVNYFVHIPASEFQTGQPLFGYKSVPGNGGDVAIDDNVDENGIDNGLPTTNGISSATIHLLANAEPTDASGETGFSNTTDNTDDDNGNLTVDFGFCYNPLTVSILGTDSICIGGTAIFNSTVSGGTASYYQWQFSPNGTTGWTDISGANSANLTAVGLTTTSFYRVLVGGPTSGCAVISTNVESVVVVPNATASIVGANITVCSGASATLSATLSSGGAGIPTYQWRISSDGTNFSNIPGATGMVYNTGALTQTRHFQVVITFLGSNCGAVTSASGTVNVVPDPAVSVSGGGTFCSGASVTLTANTSGGTGTCTRQWQRKIGSVWSDVAGATNPTLTVSNLTATAIYRTRFSCTGSNCDPVTSDSVVLTVVPGLAFVDQPDGAVACVGGSTTFTGSISGGTGTITYQWQRMSGAIWANVSNGSPTGASYAGATTNSLTVSGITAIGSYDFRLVVSAAGGGCGQIFSETTTLDLVPPPTASLTGTSCDATLTTYTAAFNLVSGVITAATGGISTGDEILQIPVGQNITVTVDEFGCPLVIPVTAPACPCPALLAPVNPGNQSICFGAPVPTLTVTVPAGTTADWYNAPAGGSLVASGASFYPGASLAVGTYTWYVETRDPLSGCTSSGRTTVVFTVNARPSVVAGVDATICPSSSYALSATASSGAGGYSFAWDNGVSAVASPTVSPTRPTTYTVTVTDATGCTATDNQAIALNPAPVFSLSVRGSCPTNLQGVTILAYQNIVPGNTEVSVNGGPWQPYPAGGTLSGLVLGNNTIAVRINGGCTTVKTVTVGMSN